MSQLTKVLPSQLIHGSNLTNEQKELIPFRGMKNPEWVKCHSFYFNSEGTALSTEPNEYYTVCKSLSFLPN